MEKITVLMSVYNENVDILSAAIESILNQTYKEFRFLIIIDNRRNVDAINTIKKYQEADSRIVYLINDKNLGLALSLNRGIEVIDTEYIARMDADDISSPDRLEKQLAFIQSNSTVSLIGCNVVYMAPDGSTIAKRGMIPTDLKAIAKTMKYQNVLNHPTFFGKTTTFKKYKYRELRYSQDYDFVCRLLEHGEIVLNLPDYLLRYRTNPNVSENKRVEQKITMISIRELYNKGRLSNSNIVAIVQKRAKSVDGSKMILALKLYDKSLLYYHKKKFALSIFYLLSSAIKSKVVLSEIKYTLCYYLIKKSWK